jgi:uncharacterized protein YhfF
MVCTGTEFAACSRLMIPQNKSNVLESVTIGGAPCLWENKKHEYNCLVKTIGVFYWS